MRENITFAKNRVVEYIQDTSKHQFVDFVIEELLNSYEESCAKYLDKKIKQKRFKKTYCDEIKNIVESKDLKEYFRFGGKYDAIKKVYSEWFEIE